MTSATSDHPSPEPVIALPDLEESSDAGIVPENIRAIGPMIVAALIEELKVGAVADRIVEQFQRGGLPIGRGGALRRSRIRIRERIGRRDRRRLEAIVRETVSRAAAEALCRLSDRAAAASTADDSSAAPAT